MTTLKLILLVCGLIPAWGKPGANSDNPFNIKKVNTHIYVNLNKSELNLYYWRASKPAKPARLLITWE